MVTIMPVHTPEIWIASVCICALAAMVSGLSGFGFSAVASPSLAILPIEQGLALLMSLSLVIQCSSAIRMRSLQSTRRKKPADRQALVPYLVGGVMGLPFGLLMLSVVDKSALLLLLGLCLIAFAGFAGYAMYCHTADIAANHKPTALQSGCLGFVGGWMGGVCAFPSAAIVIWNAMHGVTKDAGRALMGPFIICMQVLALTLLLTQFLEIFIRPEFLQLLLFAMPLALFTNNLGLYIYAKTGDAVYKKITLIVLGVSGFLMVIKAHFI
jgi:uncharacterized protein